MNVTRRKFSNLTLGGLASVSVLSPARATEDVQSRIETALKAMSTPDHRLQLTEFCLDQNGLTAVVELTWPPGTRSRRFSTSVQTPNAAADELLARVEEAFAPALT
ncbi:MAG: hypothetical protein AAFY06_07285 [Pseudomonadota bacterium]